MNDNQFFQAALPAAKDGLGVSSAFLLALFAFLASAVEAKKCLKRGFLVFSMWIKTIRISLKASLNLEKLT